MLKIAEVKSRSSNKWYNISVWGIYINRSIQYDAGKTAQNLGCSCPSWTKRMPRQDCVHLSTLKLNALAGLNIDFTKFRSAAPFDAWAIDYRRSVTGASSTAPSTARSGIEGSLQNINTSTQRVSVPPATTQSRTQSRITPPVQPVVQPVLAPPAICEHKENTKSCRICKAIANGDDAAARFLLLELE